jgi:chromate reductase
MDRGSPDKSVGSKEGTGAMRLLFFAGSAREGSYNKKLARLAQHIATANGIEGVYVDLRDYPMPLYDGDLEAEQGPPAKAAEFKALLGEYQGVFIACPEYNSSITPLLKNTLDWVTRVRAEGETGLEVYRTRVFAISGASPGYYGAMRSLLTVRQVLVIGLGATVIPQQLALPRANNAFEEDGSLKDEAQQKMLTGVVEALTVAAKRFAAP